MRAMLEELQSEDAAASCNSSHVLLWVCVPDDPNAPLRESAAGQGGGGEGQNGGADDGGGRRGALTASAEAEPVCCNDGTPGGQQTDGLANQTELSTGARETETTFLPNSDEDGGGRRTKGRRDARDKRRAKHDSRDGGIDPSNKRPSSKIR